MNWAASPFRHKCLGFLLQHIKRTPDNAEERIELMPEVVKKYLYLKLWTARM